MESGRDMGQITTVEAIRSPSKRYTPARTFTALEVALLYAGIMGYIWRWQYPYPHAWMALYAVILASHVLHRDTFVGLGLTLTELLASARLALPLAILLCLLMLFYGFARHRLLLIQPTAQSLIPLLGYGSWCLFQQYLTRARGTNRRPSMPLRAISGMKAAITIKIAKRTGRPI